LLLIGAAFVSAPAASADRSFQMFHHGIVKAARVPSAGLLYSQNDQDAGIAVSSQDFGTESDQGADDFEVPGGVTWTVKKMRVTGVYYNGYGPADSENVFFYRDSGGLPGTLKAEVDNVVGTDDGGPFVIPTGGVRLKGGAGGTVFWVSVQINMSFLNGGQWAWETRKVQEGNPAAWRNPTGEWGFCRTWEVLHDCWQSAGPDFMFALSGKQS
jgi:hypothetical protein